MTDLPGRAPPPAAALTPSERVLLHASRFSAGTSSAMQCADAIWKEALDRLLDRADVVVADLSALSERNQGVAYEIGRLVERVPLRRVVLLVHDSTDMEVFRRVLARAAAGMTPSSPNHGAARGPLVIDVGGRTLRDANESAAAWRRRMDQRVDEEHLVGLLLDAAGAGAYRTDVSLP